jgi:hypothetical protein
MRRARLVYLQYRTAILRCLHNRSECMFINGRQRA